MLCAGVDVICECMLKEQREASLSISLGMDSDHDECAEWMSVFESIVQLLDDYEQYRHNTANVSARENIAIRMESVVVLLQQVIACKSGVLFVY